MKHSYMKTTIHIILFSMEMILLIAAVGYPLCNQGPVAERACLSQPQKLVFSVDSTATELSCLERIRVYYSLSDRKLSGCVELNVNPRSLARQECELPKGAFGFRLDFVYKPNGPALNAPFPLKELSLGGKNLLADAPLTSVILPSIRSVGWMYEPKIFMGGYIWHLVICGGIIYCIALILFVWFLVRKRPSGRLGVCANYVSGNHEIG